MSGPRCVRVADAKNSRVGCRRNPGRSSRGRTVAELVVERKFSTRPAVAAAISVLGLVKFGKPGRCVGPRDSRLRCPSTGRATGGGEFIGRQPAKIGFCARVSGRAPRATGGTANARSGRGSDRVHSPANCKGEG